MSDEERTWCDNELRNVTALGWVAYRAHNADGVRPQREALVLLRDAVAGDDARRAKEAERIEAARAEEREACARVAAERSDAQALCEDETILVYERRRIAAAIRARGAKGT